MSSINGVNNIFPAPQIKAGEARKKAVPEETGEGLNVSMNKLIIELTLNFRAESKNSFGTQAGVKALSDPAGIDLSAFQYNGRPITDLSQDEAKALISEDGYFGVENTAKRIFDFVSGMAGDDLEKMQIAKDAVLKGFDEAKEAFGGTLPDISHRTINRALEMIGTKISSLGGSVVSVKA